jgi:hypothetical protein
MNHLENELVLNGCENEDVISFPSGMYRADQIAKAFKGQLPNISARTCELLKQNNRIEVPPSLFQDGISCEVLGVNSKGWKKGQVRVKFELEFVPDEIEVIQGEESSSSDSSLDSLRAVAN